MKGQNNNWYRPKLERERVRLEQQHSIRALRGLKNETAMRAAFLRALHVFVQKNSSADIAAITLPVGTVTTAELAQVITALLAARHTS
jgi:hypothetical protein